MTLNTPLKNGVITLFGQLELQDLYRQQLQNLAQTSSESVPCYAARTTDLTMRAVNKFAIKLQFDIAVEHFISGLRDRSTYDYLRNERARRSIHWQTAI